MNDLATTFQLNNSALANLTSAVQFGFIIGTLIFALLTIADRYSPSRIFFISAIVGALFNTLSILEGNTLFSLLVLRFLVGFSLAGIYPIGMKIAADYFQKGLGLSLSFIVAALVIGTAFPHLLKDFTAGISWKMVMIITSLIALLGGVSIILFVPDGPYREESRKMDLKVMLKVFENRKFRAAAFGYFGHMWEVYAFWAFVPVILFNFSKLHPEIALNIPLLSFFIIAGGGLACVVGGYIAKEFGTKKTAFLFLTLSCICCLFSPLMFLLNSKTFLIAYLLFWGLVVIADSPLFSTLVANNADPETRGTGLTIVNSIGFAITIISIQMLSILHNSFPKIIDTQYFYMLLAIGPILGLLEMNRNKEMV